jgi:UDPglucose--hexose-1-phosphate uridylyltransferase
VHGGPVAQTERVWKSSGRLADGREIIYFDESPGSGRAGIPDRRELSTEPPRTMMRFDELAGEWVVIAAERQDRTFLPPAEDCPLCPSAPGRRTEVPAPDYDVVVFENRFPSMYGAGNPAPAGPVPPGGRLEAESPARGRCEVVCFTSDHDASFASLPPSRVQTVLEAWIDRTTVLSAMEPVRQVYCFENRGEEIGVTLHHPHGQIYGYPFVTPRTRAMLNQARGYRHDTGRNLFDDLLAAELGDGSRIVERNDHWVAFVPFAARWPYEVRIFPSTRVASLPGLDEAQRAAYGPLYLSVLRRFDGLFGMRMPYVAGWHQAPSGDPFAAENFAAHLQVFSIRRAPGKLKYAAGSESGMGVWIGDVPPELAARRLRDAL